MKYFHLLPEHEVGKQSSGSVFSYKGYLNGEGVTYAFYQEKGPDHLSIVKFTN